jgi:hypothetical protein
MAEHEEAEPTTETTRDDLGGGASSGQLRQLSLPQRRLGGYAREAVDDTISKAAQTIERLQADVTVAREEVGRLQAAQAKLEDELKVAMSRSPQEVVGDVLVTAHRAAASVLAEARRQAAHEQEASQRETLAILAKARTLLDQAASTHRNAQSAAADAHARAEGVIAAGEVEANARVARATEAAAGRQAQLEIENARLETAIKGLRSEWVGRAAEALARLERVDPGRSLGASARDASGTEVVQDLQERVQKERTGTVPRRLSE